MVTKKSFLPTVSKRLFKDAPITTIDASLKSVNDTLFVYSETAPRKGNGHFFGLNIAKVKKAEFVVMVLGNDLNCLKIPSEFLLHLPLYKDPLKKRFLVEIEFNENTHDYSLLHKADHSNKTSTNCTKFIYSLLTEKEQITMSLGLRNLILNG